MRKFGILRRKLTAEEDLHPFRAGDTNEHLAKLARAALSASEDPNVQPSVLFADQWDAFSLVSGEWCQVGPVERNTERTQRLLSGLLGQEVQLGLLTSEGLDPNTGHPYGRLFFELVDPNSK